MSGYYSNMAPGTVKRAQRKKTLARTFLMNLDKNHGKKEKRLEIIKPIKNLSASKLVHQTKLGTPGRNNEQQFTRCKINLNPNIRNASSSFQILINNYILFELVFRS